MRMYVLPGFLLDLMDDNWSCLTWGKGLISTGDCRPASANVSVAVEVNGKNAPSDVEGEALLSTKINYKATLVWLFDA